MKRKDDGNALWENVRQGDLKAFDQIYHLYVERLMAYGLSIVGDKAVVKDGIQNVFIQLWKGRHSIKIKTSVAQYILASLRHEVVRLSKRKQHLSPLSDNELKLVSEESIEDKIIEEEDRRLIKISLSKMLSTLSLRQQEALHLKYQEQLTNTEISTMMGIKKNGVYKLIFTALTSLRKKM